MGPSSLPSVYPRVESRGAGGCLVLSVRAACSLASELLASVLPLPGRGRRRPRRRTLRERAGVGAGVGAGAAAEC